MRINFCLQAIEECFSFSGEFHVNNGETGEKKVNDSWEDMLLAGDGTSGFSPVDLILSEETSEYRGKILLAEQYKPG